MESKTKTIKEWGIPGNELRTSRTQIENHITRLNTLFMTLIMFISVLYSLIPSVLVLILDFQWAYPKRIWSRDSKITKRIVKLWSLAIDEILVSLCSWSTVQKAFRPLDDLKFGSYQIILVISGTLVDTQLDINICRFFFSLWIHW